MEQPATSASFEIFETTVWFGVIALLSFSLVGLGLAMCGWFHPAAVATGTIALTAAGWLWLWPVARAPEGRSRAPRLLTLAVVILAVASGLWNGANHGEHLLAERDPGVYAATGLVLADTGTLRVSPPSGPFEDASGLTGFEIGFTPNDAGSLDAQFVHLNAVFLGAASWFGGTKLFLVPAALMAMALVLMYAIGTRFGRPFGGAFSALAFAVSYPFLYVARDTYSEPLALVLLLAGLWALTFVRRGGLRAGLIAGALLGATCMVRIDGYIPLIAIAGIIAMEIVLARRVGDRRHALGLWGAYASMVVCAGIGGFETWAFSRAYYDTNLDGRIQTMVAAALVATVIGALAGRFAFRREHQTVAAHGLLRWGLAVIAVGVAGIVVWARYLRPDFTGLRHAIDRGNTTIELLPWAKTLSYLWLEWYLGPVLVAGGIAALIWMTWHALFSSTRRWLPVAGVGFSTTLLYLISPTITPDQPWAIRRFVAVSIPILLLAVGLALESLGRRRVPWSAVAAVAVGAILLLPVVRVTNRLADTSIGSTLGTRFDQVCAIAYEQPSAILVTSGRLLGHTMPVALRGWCEVPVAGAGDDITAAEIDDLAVAWKDQGRRLLLVTTSEEGLAGVDGPTVAVPGPPLLRPEATVDRVPERFKPDTRLSLSSDGILPLYVIEVR